MTISNIDMGDNNVHIYIINEYVLLKSEVLVLQAEHNSTRARCDHLDEQNQLLKRQLKFATQKVQQLMAENRTLTGKLEKFKGERSKLDVSEVFDRSSSWYINIKSIMSFY